MNWLRICVLVNITKGHWIADDPLVLQTIFSISNVYVGDGKRRAWIELKSFKGLHMAYFEQAAVKTLMREGGTTLFNGAIDKGGLCRFGISQRDFPQLDIHNLTEQKARQIYRIEYWDKLNASAIGSQAVAENIFNSAISMGVDTTLGIIKLTLGGQCKHGILHGCVIEAINSVDPDILLCDFTLHKIGRYLQICKQNPEQEKFLLGWLERTLSCWGSLPVLLEYN